VAGFGLLICLALLLHMAHTLQAVGSPGYDDLIENWVYVFITLGTAAMVLGRAAVRRDGRRAWLLVGGGLLMWGFSDLYTAGVLAGQESPPFPTIADVGYLLGYPLVLFGVALLVELRIRKMSLTAWIDVLIGVLSVATLGTTLLMEFVLDNVNGSSIEVGVTVAYPILDLMALSIAVAALALTGWRPGRALALVSVGIGAIAISDAVYVQQSLAGTYTSNDPINSFWSLGAVLIAFGALQRESSFQRIPGHVEGWRSFASPSVFALAVLAFQLLAHPGQTPILQALTIGTLVATVFRLALTFTENRRLVSLLQQDSLTSLGNRSKLFVDVKRTLSDEEGEPHTLTILDLDGFKAYNDAFGHPAGDALLIRLGRQLSESMEGRGKAYRLGGDEFAVLVPGDIEESKEVVKEASSALGEHGEGFKITSSFGSAEMPGEARDVANALQLADKRMYVHKDSRRPTPAGEVQAVLVRILQQRAPDLGSHGDAVSTVAMAVAREMELPPGEVAAVARAAELHDVGKMAIPDAILEKPGPLDDEEWEFMRQHTILGERILSASNSLAPLGKLVRASHERWDGNGYPDGLQGEEIPLASRIVFVCDAYDAMIRERPYARARSSREALAELRRGAGTQFDPDVVESFAKILGSAARNGSRNGHGTADTDDWSRDGSREVVRLL
jgi:diguanylate cyclase (GGDEF)-like protein